MTNRQRDLDPRRAVPRTDVVLADARLADPLQRLGRDRVKRAVAWAQGQVRQQKVAPADVVDAVLAALPPIASTLRPVLNATGVLLHTNLGRAPLSAAAVEAMVAASGTTDVEFDLASGSRAPRGRGALAALRRAVPAAEDVHVVNNGAAALLLLAATLAVQREIIVSRGELIEIGDGFRIPELLESTGARLREVGTTNRTTPDDYFEAIGPDTAFVLKVHPSNFHVSGFTRSVRISELAEIPAPVIADIGSGLLAPHPLLPDEPDAASALADGAALVTASGDKLLGGPQAGLLLGRAELIQRIRRHPMARAVRVDKLTLAALEATVAGPLTPTALALRGTRPALLERTEALAEQLRKAGVEVEVLPHDGVVGGGGAPATLLGGFALALPESWAQPLRIGEPPVVGVLEGGRLLLDLRCVPAERDDDLRNAVFNARP